MWINIKTPQLVIVSLGVHMCTLNTYNIMYTYMYTCNIHSYSVHVLACTVHSRPVCVQL